MKSLLKVWRPLVSQGQLAWLVNTVFKARQVIFRLITTPDLETESRRHYWLCEGAFVQGAGTEFYGQTTIASRPEGD